MKFMRKLGLTLMVAGLFISQGQVVRADSGFKDIDNHWASEYIEFLHEKDVIGGYFDGTFRPDDPIRVDEFLVLCLKLIPNYSVTDSDQYRYWATPYINDALKMQIINPDDFRYFERFITREEMSKIVMSTLGKSEVINATNNNRLLSNISDYALIDDAYKEYVLEMFAMGLLSGDDHQAFLPKENLTRAEASVIAYKMMNPKSREEDMVTDWSWTQAYYQFYTDNGFENLPIRLYAPTTDKGQEWLLPLELYETFLPISLQTNKNWELHYNPYSQSIALNYGTDNSDIGIATLKCDMFGFEKKEYPIILLINTNDKSKIDQITSDKDFISLCQLLFDNDSVKIIKVIKDSDHVNGYTTQYTSDNGKVISVDKGEEILLKVSLPDYYQ